MQTVEKEVILEDQQIEEMKDLVKDELQATEEGPRKRRVLGMLACGRFLYEEIGEPVNLQ
jgi:hypothetical protein